MMAPIMGVQYAQKELTGRFSEHFRVGSLYNRVLTGTDTSGRTLAHVQGTWLSFFTRVTTSGLSIGTWVLNEIGVF